MSTAINFTALTKKDIQAALGLSERSIEILVKKGHFPPGARIGKHLYWSAEAVNKWLSDKFNGQMTFKPKSKK